MAYGSWSNYAWSQIWNNGYYAVDLRYRYRQDPIANKTQYELYGQRCRSVNGYYSYSTYNQQYGYQFVNYGKVVDGKQYYSVSAGGTGSQVGNSISIEKNNRADGTFEMPAISAHWICNLGGGNNVPEWDWKNVSMPSPPKIDRTAPKITAISISEITIDSVKVNLTSDSNSNLIEYSFDVGVPDNESTWEDSGVTIPTDYGGSTSFKIEGLNPNKEYSIKVRVRRTLNHVFSDSKVVTFETISDPPLAPCDLMATNVTSNTITLEWDLVENAVKYRLFKDQSLYVETPDSSYTVTDLQPNRAYTFAVSAVDEYEQFSPLSDAITIRTLDDVSKIHINVGGVYRTGKVFVNVNGEMKPVKKIYVNVDEKQRPVK